MVGNLLHCAADVVEATASQDGHITKLSDFSSLLVQMYNNKTSKSGPCLYWVPVCTHGSLLKSPGCALFSSQDLDVVPAAAAASCR